MSALGDSKVDVSELTAEWSTLMRDDRLTKIITSSVSMAAEEKKKELSEAKELTTLMQWVNVESSHPYECPSHIQKSFYQPGAIVFDIEFAPACIIDSNDYLTFISDRGRKTTIKVRAHEKKTWPNKRLSIRSKDQLQFVFHSEIRTSSTKYWGYKFSITAKGILTPVLGAWAPDLFLTLTRFGGQLLSVRTNNFEGEKSGIDKNENDISTGSSEGAVISKNKAFCLRTLELAKQFLEHFRAVDECDKPGASLICLTFLRSSLDAVSNFMDSSNWKGLHF